MSHTIPSMPALLVQAAFSKDSKGIRNAQSLSLPNKPIESRLKPIKAEKISAFHQLIDWQQNACLHPCVMHTLVFPFHLQLMLSSTFPFKAMGTVHLANKIHQLQAITHTEALSLSCAFTGLDKTDKGWEFVINADVYQAGHLVWHSQSRYLKRMPRGESSGKTFRNTSDKHAQYADSPPLHAKHADGHQSEILESLIFQSDSGRRYAKLSGDYNPIHLSTLSARLLGFRKHIAHGMFTKALCLSRLVNASETKPTGFIGCEVTFKRPLFLPAQTQLTIKQTKPAAHTFKLSGQSETAKSSAKPDIHLTGECAFQSL